MTAVIRFFLLSLISLGALAWSEMVLADEVELATKTSSDFSVTTTVEYQQISQEFYDPSYNTFDTTTIDIIETWNLSWDRIEDFIFRTNLKYRLVGLTNRLDLLGNFELSGDRLLGRAEGYYRIGDYYNNLKLFGKFENKTAQGDPEDSDQGYNYFQTWIRGNRRLTKSVTVFGRVGFESIGFESLPEIVVDSSESNLTTLPRGYYNFDYSIISGRVGGNIALSDFSQRLDWRAEFSHREVPDSAEANYDRYIFGLDYSYLGLSGYFNLEAEGSLKDYLQPGGGRDFYSFTSSLRGQRSLGSRFKLATVLQLNAYQYKVPDLIYNDYSLVRWEISAPVDIKGWETGPLVRSEYRNEAPTESYSEEFRQWELGLVSDYFGLNGLSGSGGGSLILTGELTFGKREYLFGGDILSSYQFVSTSVMAGWSISEHLRIDLLFDGSFETHDRAVDDSNLYLLSVGVSTRF